ncbi:MAG: hypothetical protein KIT34_04465 [Cyanobacteria bacterium TGS_CYA1]|nr:hypothetical protein [Cyanobacteria bacterium TGS_CYA1]
MIDSVFERAGESLLNIIQCSMAECLNLQHSYVCTEHILLALTDDKDSLAAKILASLNILEEPTRAEIERKFKGETESELLYSDRMDLIESGFDKQQDGSLGFSDLAVQALVRAFDYSLFFGQPDIEPVHLLLGLIDLPDSSSTKILEDLGCNLFFLRRQTLNHKAKELSTVHDLPGFKDTTIGGIRELIDRFYGAVCTLNSLSTRSQIQTNLPVRQAIVHKVCVAYFAEFLYTQVTFRRYLIEETIQLLSERTGPLDQEIIGSIITTSAQNVRSDARAAFEYMISNEYRLFEQMMDEAEYDEIGNIIEDLWWIQGEEIALYDLFAEAMDDRRREQMFEMQKRRMEIASKLTSLKNRLLSTVRSCFEKRSIAR